MAVRKFKIKIDGKVFEAEVEEIGSGDIRPAVAPSGAQPIPTQTPQTVPTGGNTITSPMPGKIISINVKKGDQVKVGDVVLILEAMKMEQQVKSTVTGMVADILVAQGDTVKKDQALIIIA
ncbi:MAG: biotin/lipoyl-binding protein [Desulfobacterota bacterium]|nr:biotin/lipoyl-binding protein [Thermodesulfobacteriota bacterium]